MDIEDWPSAKTLPALYRELKQLDLLEHVAELEAFGFTVLPPEKVGPPQQHEAVRDALLDVACERKGCSQAELPGVFSDDQELLRFMLWDDPLFEKIVVNPAALGLVEYLLGSQCILSLCDGWVKGAGDARTGVHCDWAQFEMPTFPPEPYTANFNYLLSDYTKEDGALGFVPGSHRWRRWPSPEEAEYWNDRCHPIEAPFGSMIVWGDHTWHGSYPRRTQGLRLMMLGTFCRPHMQTQEPFRQTVAQAALDRNPLRFARLMDVRGAFSVRQVAAASSKVEGRRIVRRPRGPRWPSELAGRRTGRRTGRAAPGGGFRPLRRRVRPGDGEGQAQGDSLSRSLPRAAAQAGGVIRTNHAHKR